MNSNGQRNSVSILTAGVWVHTWKVPESLLVRELLLVSRRDTGAVSRGTEPVDRRRVVIERVKTEIRQVARAAFASTG